MLKGMKTISILSLVLLAACGSPFQSEAAPPGAKLDDAQSEAAADPETSTPDAVPDAAEQDAQPPLDAAPEASTPDAVPDAAEQDAQPPLDAAPEASTPDVLAQDADASSPTNDAGIEASLNPTDADIPPCHYSIGCPAAGLVGCCLVLADAGPPTSGLCYYTSSSALSGQSLCTIEQYEGVGVVWSSKLP